MQQRYWKSGVLLPITLNGKSKAGSGVQTFFNIRSFSAFEYVFPTQNEMSFAGDFSAELDSGCWLAS